MSSYGTLRGRTNVIPIAIGVTLLVSMLPSSWLSWTSDLADLVRVPVTPVSHVGMMLTNWMRPSIELYDLPGDEQVRSELMSAERDQYKQLYQAQLLRANDLADQLRLMQALPETSFRNPLPPVTLSLDITGLKPDDMNGIVELKLARGASKRIRVGDIAVVGIDIIGRISRVGVTRIELRPTTHQDVGLIRAAVVPSQIPEEDTKPLLAEILLRSLGDGNLYAEARTVSDIKLGDHVILSDPTWSLVGAGLVLGTVTEIIPLDEAPLRVALTVTPRRRVRDVTAVVILASGEVVVR